MPVSSVVRAQTIAGSPQIIKTYVGGLFTSYTGETSVVRNKFVSLQPTGYVNTSFNLGGNYFSGDTMSAVTVNSIAVQSDGKIIVGGNFKYYITSTSAYTCSNLIRLNSDGSVDSIYKGSFNGPINTVAVDYSGRTIVGGGFTTYSGVNYNRIIRFSSDTTVDTTFGNPDPLAFNDEVNVIVPTPYHKHAGGGNAYTYLVGGKIQNLMVEMTYAGNILSNAFNTFTGTSVNTIALNTISLFEDSIGKYTVYIGGNFTGYSNTTYNCIVSTNNEGAAQPTFSGSSDGFNKPVRSIVVHPNNKLLVGGEFQSFSGAAGASDYFIILNTDGTPQVKGYDFNGYVNTIELDCCGKFLVGGEFTSVLSTTVNYMTRFLPDGGQLDKNTFFGNGFNNFVKTIYYSKT